MFGSRNAHYKLSNWLGKKPVPPPSTTPEEFLQSLALIVDIDQLLGNFTAKLRETFDACTLYVVLFEPITSRYVGTRAKGDHPELLIEFNFSRSDNLIKWLNVNKCPLDLVKQTGVVKFLSAAEQQLLHKTSTQLVVPLITINRLTGALFLTNKANGSTYSLSEIQTISMLASRSALAIEYAVIYQFQEEKLKKLFHADKLATVGELAAGAAHEIRNPLTSIRSTIQYLQKDLPTERKALVSGILEEVDRIDQIITGLLSLSKVAELNIEVVNLSDILDQTLLLLEPELRKHNIQVHREYDRLAVQIMADASQLRQVFLNILLNSVQAMPHGGRIRISTELAAGDSLSVAIEDTGPGIPAEDFSRVFDPFYTTKEGGTGLGLSISYGIISKHGGHIDLKSLTEGAQAGTTVVVRLPKAMREQATVSSERPISDAASERHFLGTA